MDIDIPEDYDWRQEYPHCVKPVMSVGTNNCSASYTITTISAIEDRICMASKNEDLEDRNVRLSVQELLDCDSSNA
jgi:hypothetical protein